MDTTSGVALSPPMGATNHVVLTTPKAVIASSESTLRHRQKMLSRIVLGALFLSYSCLIFSLYMTAFRPLTHISPMILVVTWIGALVFGIATYLADQRCRRYDTSPNA